MQKKLMFDCLLSTPFGIGLTLSWRRPLSYRSQSIDLLCKSMDWFQYDNGLRHERVNVFFAGLKWLFLTWSFHSLDIVLVWVGDCSYIRIKSHILRDFVLVLVLEPLVVFLILSIDWVLNTPLFIVISGSKWVFARR